MKTAEKKADCCKLMSFIIKIISDYKQKAIIKSLKE
jgi:hypothetical protein